MKLTPRSTARRSARRLSSSSAPIHIPLPMPQAPKPISETISPVRPSLLVFMSRSRQEQQLPLDVAGDLGRPLAHVDVDLAPHAELGQVDARLDREADSGDDRPLVAGLEVVDVHPVAVDLVADGVAGPVEEVRAVAALVDVAARDVVHLVPVDGAAGAHG